MIRLHLFDLDRPPAPVSDLRGILAVAEVERADRFHRPRDRDRFVTGRALLRTLLGDALDATPASVELAYGPHGKPRLADASRAGPTFGVSHADNLLAVALRRGGSDAVGVDVEFVRPVDAPAELAERVFLRDEADDVVSAASGGDWSVFHRYWTAKEAVLKALGTGLSLDPRALRVRPRHGDAFRVEPGPDPMAASPSDLPDRGVWVTVRVPGPQADDAVAIVALAPVAEHETLEIRSAPPLSALGGDVGA